MSAAHDHDDPNLHDDAATLAVLATHTTSAGKTVRSLRVVRPRPEDANFLVATAKGLGITLKHFAKNFFLPLRSKEARAKLGAPDSISGNEIETVQYPEEKVTYPERFRGLHRLMLRDDGAVRCVACMCCPTVCPAHCITIIPEESDSKGIEKRPAVFEIDELRCVVCGLCVEACPCDAIRMDTGMHALPVEDRGNAIETKESMMSRGIKSVAKQGGEGPTWRTTAPVPPSDKR
ncbi:MAG TPA: NADH-quinone oxidoreductase subunit I [Kofleriaceae bacterium]|jgi:NADH-quinone oxidoreductase subunit I